MLTRAHATDREFEAAVAAARAAGDALSHARRAVLASAGRDIKAQADLDAESAMMDVLRPLGLPILSEEMGADAGFGLDRDGWIIDPLDGTMNFVRGIPIACACVALWRDGGPVVGVIHELGINRTWTGGVERHASVDGRSCRCSTTAAAGDAVLATGFPRGMAFGEASMAAYARRMAAFKKIRMIGSAGLSLAWAAGGLVDVYLEDDIFIWDVAAGLAIIEAAGGRSLFTPPDASWRTCVVAGAPLLAEGEWAASGRPTA